MEENKIKLPKLTDSYIFNVKKMRASYAHAKRECLKVLETSTGIGMADGDILKKLAESLRFQDKTPDGGSQWWTCSTQIREHLSKASLETFRILNDDVLQAMFWDDRIPDAEEYLKLPPEYHIWGG